MITIKTKEKSLEIEAKEKKQREKRLRQLKDDRKALVKEDLKESKASVSDEDSASETSDASVPPKNKKRRRSLPKRDYAEVVSSAQDPFLAAFQRLTTPVADPVAMARVELDRAIFEHQKEKENRKEAKKAAKREAKSQGR